MATRKILLIGRHGKAPQRPEGGSFDELVPEAVGEICRDVGVPLQEAVQDIKQEDTFLTHTDAVRTLYTGQAVLVGAFDMQPSEGTNPPQSHEDLALYDFSRIDTTEDLRFKIEDIHCNLEVYKRDGGNAIINYWLANPTATEHDGVEIVPYESLRGRVMEGTRAGINSLASGDKDLGIIASHASIAEPVVMSLINSARKVPIERVEDIGGSFGMAEFAQLELVRTPSGMYTARLKVKDEEYDVDLYKL